MNYLLAKFKHRAIVRRRAHNIQDIRTNKLATEIFNRIIETFDPLLITIDNDYPDTFIYGDKIKISYWADHEDCGYNLYVDHIHIDATYELLDRIFDYLRRGYQNQTIELRLKNTIDSICRKHPI